MSALYIIDFVGRAGGGGGALYIGKGKIAGVDAGRVIYDGTYGENGDKLEGTVTLTATAPDSFLVTGRPFPAGQKVEVPFTLPSHFGNGEEHVLSVAGQHVIVRFQKISDIP